MENNELHLIYQRDFEPGLSVRGDEDPADINDIVHLSIPADGLNDCADVEVAEPQSVAEIWAADDVRLFPNPATEAVDLIIDVQGMVQVRVFSPLGAVVMDTQVNAPLMRLDVAGWSNGLYLVEVQQAGQRMVKQLAIAH